MIMDRDFSQFSDSIDYIRYDDETVLPGFDLPQNANGYKLQDGDLDFNFTDIPYELPDVDPTNFPPSSSASSEVQSPDDNEFAEGVFKFLNQILMEENVEDKPSMFHDPLALREAEKSLYETIGERYPPSPNIPPLYFDQNVESPRDESYGSPSPTSNSINTSNSVGDSSDAPWIVDPMKDNTSVFTSDSSEYSMPLTSQTNSQWSSDYINNLSDNTNGKMGPSVSTMVSSIFSDSESISLFKKGMEEARKFLPPESQLIVDLGNYELPPQSTEEATVDIVKVEKDEKEDTINGLRGRKNHFREDSNLDEERQSKQSATYDEDTELSALFDRVLLFGDIKEAGCCTEDGETQSELIESWQQNGPQYRSNGEKNRSRKQAGKEEVVDLRTLLINCAQSVASDDHKSATEQLKLIRQHSSPSGDATQRLAEIFANGLEARMVGTGSDIYASLVARKISATEKLRAYQLYLSASPFKQIAIFFANKMIVGLLTNSTKKKLHIIDFGIQYGFQWPILIQHLSTLPDGPPELRITGIEFPQHGFRPLEFVEETGRRLGKYCERFKVPFRYHAIAQKWETIKIEDLKIESDELVAVNCLLRFQNLLDETVEVNSPRDTVLKLMRKINPSIFTHSIINGSYSAPFFVTRFREALFHYSAWFDMLDTNSSREDQARMDLEKEFYGREVMNIIACEGSERVERPETYKQWQIRTMRAGFKILPLKQELLDKFRGKVRAGYHRDFVVDTDGQWMLQGWKGRLLYASSCWVPA